MSPHYRRALTIVLTITSFWSVLGMYNGCRHAERETRLTREVRVLRHDVATLRNQRGALETETRIHREYEAKLRDQNRELRETCARNSP